MPMPDPSASMLARLRLFQIISPSLPVGGFTYSQGMEWAVECGWLSTQAETAQWLDSALNDSLRYLELPIIKRLYEAVSNHSSQQFSDWSQYLLASRETFELRTEERQRARAFCELLRKLPQWRDEPMLDQYREGMLMSQSAGFALAGNQWQVPLDELLAGFTWAWLENAVNAAIKLVPLGQTAGQTLLYQLSEQIPKIIDAALVVEDDQLGASTASLAIASSLHETQYCRLFRS